MRRVFLDLDDKARCLLTNDETIIMLEEYDYTPAFFVDLQDKLALGIESMVVITHNFLTSCLFEGGFIAFQTDKPKLPLCIECTDDVRKLVDAAEHAGVKDVKFVSKLGYFAMLGKSDTGYVEQVNGVCHLICVDNGIKDLRVCSMNALEKNKEVFSNLNSLLKMVDARELYDTDMLMAFNNAALLLDDDEACKDLSVFAYAMMADEQYCYGKEALGKSFESIMSAQQERVSETNQKEAMPVDDLMDVSNLCGQTFKEKEEPKRKLLAKAATITVVSLSLVLSAVSVVGSQIYAGGISDKKKEVAELQEKYASTTGLNELYMYCANTGENKVFSILRNISESISANGGNVLSVKGDTNQSKIRVLFPSEEAAGKFMESVGGSVAVSDKKMVGEGPQMEITVSD